MTNSSPQLPASAPGTEFCPISSISVIYPALNEEANIRHTVEAACRTLSELADQWEVIVVNDGSRDNTGKICDELAAANPCVRVVHHPMNRGYGVALRNGFSAARHEYLFFSDSDGQFDIRELRDLIPWSGKFDIVAGYRARRNDPPHRLFNAWGWKVLVRALLGVKLRDLDCAFKLFRHELFERIQIRSVGSMVNAEMMAQAVRLGMTIHEIPVSHFPRYHGTSTGAHPIVILKALRELFRMSWRLRNTSSEQMGIFRERDRVHNPAAR